MEPLQALITGVAALIGVGFGALLTRRDARRSHADRLLVDALNDLVAAVAAVGRGGGRDAQTRYASATARVALHAPADVVEAFRLFQTNAATGTADDRIRFLAALQAVRRATGADEVTDEQLRVLVFGAPATALDRPHETRTCAFCDSPFPAAPLAEAEGEAGRRERQPTQM